jgi:starvation-inducible DNA-binding protein
MPARYTELALAVDEIAERIRALVKEERGVPVAEEMIRRLAADQQTVVADARRPLAAAGAAGDEPTADLAIRRMEVHQKHAWMLRSHLA